MKIVHYHSRYNGAVFLQKKNLKFKADIKESRHQRESILLSFGPRGLSYPLLRLVKGMKTSEKSEGIDWIDIYRYIDRYIQRRGKAREIAKREREESRKRGE